MGQYGKYSIESKFNFHPCITVTDFNGAGLPEEVKDVLEELTEDLNAVEVLSDCEINCSSNSGCSPSDDSPVEWSVGSPYEGGASCIWSSYDNEGVYRWVYRDSWSGNDHAVINQGREVVASCLILATEGNPY